MFSLLDLRFKLSSSDLDVLVSSGRMAIVFGTYTYGHKLTFHINMSEPFSSNAILDK